MYGANLSLNNRLALHASLPLRLCDSRREIIRVQQEEATGSEAYHVDCLFTFVCFYPRPPGPLSIWGPKKLGWKRTEEAHVAGGMDNGVGLGMGKG